MGENLREFFKKMQEFLPSTREEYIESVEEYGEILEILGNDRMILKTAKQYMGPKTALLQIKVDEELGRLQIN